MHDMFCLQIDGTAHAVREKNLLHEDARILPFYVIDFKHIFPRIYFD